jgi:hypothetical protein
MAARVFPECAGCAEARMRFDHLVQSINFRSQTAEFQFLKAKLEARFDPLSTLTFVAYFLTLIPTSENNEW